MRDKFLPVLFLLSLMSTCLEVDISVPGFPQIADYFGVAEGVIQSTITYNFLGYCLAALFYGSLSDCFGRRRVMLFGNALLSVGAIGCFYAPSIEWLLLSRFIQGIGASTSVVLVFAMIADLYRGEKAMKLIGTMNAALSIFMAVAPLLGGIINQAIGWRGNYGSVAFFSLLTWMLLVCMLPESRTHFDSFSLKKMTRDYKTLMTSSKFIAASMIPSLLFAAYMAYIAASSFLYIGTFELSILEFVVHQAIIVSSFAVTSLYAGKIIPWFGPNKTVRNGVALCCASIIVWIALSLQHIESPYITTLFMSLFGIGFAVCYPVVFANSLSIFPELQGPASSLIMSVRAFLVALSTGVTSYVYNGQPIIVALAVFIGIFFAGLFTIGWLNINQPIENQTA